MSKRKEEIETWLENLLKDKHNELNQSEFWKKLFKEMLFSKVKDSKTFFYFIEKKTEEKIPKIRKQIFENKEFLELSKQIIEHNPKKLFLKNESPKKIVYRFSDILTNSTFKKLEKKFLQEELEATMDFLFSYGNYSTFTTKLDIYFTNVQKEFPPYCLHIGNEYTTCYIPFYCYNIDLQTQKNFFINYNDEIIPFDFQETYLENSVEIFKITENIKENYFFKKRLSDKILNEIQFILFIPQKIGNFDFLHSLFFTSEDKLTQFLDKKKDEKIRNFLKEIYYLLIRDTKVILENKQKILSRMVFSYSFYQIKKLLSLHTKIIKVLIEFPMTTAEEVSKSIETIQSFFENHPQYILIRNHFSKIMIFRKSSKEALLEIKSFLDFLNGHLPTSFKYQIQENSLKNWTFLDV